MLPFTLPPNLGSRAKTLLPEQKTMALTFSVPYPAIAARAAVEAVDDAPAVPALMAVPAGTHRYVINRVDINVQDMYLQVG